MATSFSILLSELRRRTNRRAALTVGGLLLLSLLIAALLQLFWVQVNVYTGLAPRFVFRWFVMTCVAATLLLLPLAVCAGAGGMVAEVQSGRLREWRVTPLAPMVMVTTKTFGALWHLILTVCVSAVWWSAVSVMTHRIDSMTVVRVHLLLLVLMVSYGCLAAGVAAVWHPERDSLRAQVSATVMVLLLLIATSVKLFLSNPLIRALNDPRTLISVELALNPFLAILSAAGVDALRMDWLYRLTAAPEYAFTYPPAWVTAAIYAAVGGASLWAAARRVMREEG
ncbi:MAG: hypothetical protein NZT92_03095 [Abditibacteriales bacterium]|nr:hypothetical protein [Abditibacteriales bacterium]MDW8364866.1 hypothetical protein [Abditibacteriales bacterium]